MNRFLAVSVVAAVGLFCGPVQASNDLYIDSNDDLFNSASLTISGSSNALSIEQTFDQAGGGNRIAASIAGDFNGGLGSSFSAPLTSTGLVPGQIIQSGHGNQISLSVAGNRNMFAISQIGSANALTASIIGNNNQAAILQVGAGNAVSFSQNGNDNLLSVVQRSR